jgi:hypothetical protein
MVESCFLLKVTLSSIKGTIRLANRVAIKFSCWYPMMCGSILLTGIKVRYVIIISRTVV